MMAVISNERRLQVLREPCNVTNRESITSDNRVLILRKLVRILIYNIIMYIS